VRKYRNWSRNATAGACGFAVLYQSPRFEPARVVGAARPAFPLGGRTRSRARAAARRRLVLTVLLVALGIPLLVALATGSVAAWWAVVSVLPLLCAYLAVMFRSRRLLAEREINVAFFGGPERGEFGLDDVFARSYPQEAEELPAVSVGRY